MSELWNSKSVRDASLAMAVAVLLLGLFVHVDFFEMLHEFTRAHEDWDLDELILVIFAVPLPLAWYAIRRTIDAQRESLARLVAERDLAHMRKIESLGTLAGGIAHELNNSLVPVIGVTELLLKKTSSGNEDRDKLELVLKAAGRAKETVQGILEFARREPSADDYCNVSDSMVHIEKMIRATCPGNVKLNLSCSDDAGKVNVSEDKFESLILNLFANSLDAIEESGKRQGQIDIAIARLVGMDVARHTDLATESLIRIDIRDNGIGIPSENVDKVFDPFFTTKEPGKGTGLGMASVHTTVQNAKGKISLESNPDRDTVVTVLLPECR